MMEKRIAINALIKAEPAFDHRPDEERNSREKRAIARQTVTFRRDEGEKRTRKSADGENFRIPLVGWTCLILQKRRQKLDADGN